MSSKLLSSNREAGSWARLMCPEAAEYLVSIAFAEDDRERMKAMAERSESGTLTVDETSGIGYLHVGNLLAVINRKPGSPCVGNRTASIEARPAFLPY